MKRMWPTLLSAAVLCCCAGCSQSFGALLYHLGTVRPPKIPAEYELGPGPLLIIVDDDEELLDWPQAKDRLIDLVGQLLLDARATDSVLRSQDVNAVRERDRRFHRRSITELGEIFPVNRILWIQVRDYYASGRIEDTDSTARLITRIKVFDPRAKAKAEMRLWPEAREGHFVSVEKSAIDLHRLGVQKEIPRVLIAEASDKIAKLFYEYREEE